MSSNPMNRFVKSVGIRTEDRADGSMTYLIAVHVEQSLEAAKAVRDYISSLVTTPDETKALTPSQIGRAIADNCELAPLPHPPGCECRLCLPVKATGPRLGDPHPPSCACWECNK